MNRVFGLLLLALLTSVACQHSNTDWNKPTPPAFDVRLLEGEWAATEIPSSNPEKSSTKAKEPGVFDLDGDPWVKIVSFKNQTWSSFDSLMPGFLTGTGLGESLPFVVEGWNVVYQAKSSLRTEPNQYYWTLKAVSQDEFQDGSFRYVRIHREKYEALAQRVRRLHALKKAVVSRDMSYSAKVGDRVLEVEATAQLQDATTEAKGRVVCYHDENAWRFEYRESDKSVNTGNSLKLFLSIDTGRMNEAGVADGSDASLEVHPGAGQHDSAELRMATKAAGAMDVFALSATQGRCIHRFAWKKQRLHVQFACAGFEPMAEITGSFSCQPLELKRLTNNH